MISMSMIYICLIHLMLTFVPSQSTIYCPYNGLLVLRPIDPFLFVGSSSRLCCRVLDSRNRHIVEMPDIDLTFSGRRGSVISPIPRIENSNPDEVCANITVTALEQQGFYRCAIRDQTTCQASQYVTVDYPLPSQFDISCITYGNNNVTCTPKNLPTFKYSERLSAKIIWKQMGVPDPRCCVEKRKECNHFNSCVLTPNDGMFFNLPLQFSISIQLEYQPFPNQQGSQKVVASSNFLTFDLITSVKLAPLVASVAGVNKTSIRITWHRQFASFSNKIINIRIFCETDPTDFILFREEEVIEVMSPIDEMLLNQPVETVLSELQPSTTYMIIMKTRSIAGTIWSDAVALIATTIM